MSCIKCTTTPDFPTGNKDIYVSASHDYILSKFADIIKEVKSEIKTDYLFVRTDVDKFFAENSFKELNQMEKENINLLILPVDTQPGFNHFSQAKTLDAWLTLYESSELVWILENGSISTFFQPILHADTKEIYAYECLSRGVSRNGEYMNPGKMFEMAKKTNMLFNLDRQCRETSIKTSAVKKIDKNIFINFIPTAIYNPEFCLKDTVKWAAQLEFDPKTITFEVVETEQVKNLEHLRSILEYYNDKGFMTALDDVGSGYSSLNVLAELKPNIVKLDMEMIRNIHKNETKQSIVDALINISNKLGYKIIAEGIENIEEYEWVKSREIDFIQGFMFAKPSPEPLRVI